MRTFNDTLRSVVDTTPLFANPRMLRACGAVTAFAMGAAMALFIAPPAMAHALVERSDPPANQLVLRAPKEIVLVFSEPIDPQRTEIRVLDQEGRRIDQRGFRFSANRRTTRAPVRLPGSGVYTVTWRTLSTVDLHTYEGFLTFTLGPLRPGSFAARGGAATGPSVWEALARWLMFAGAAVLMGGLAFQRFLSPTRFDSKSREDWMGVAERRWRVFGSAGTGAFLLGAVGELVAQSMRVAGAADEELVEVLAQLVLSESARLPLLLKIPTALILLLALVRSSAPVIRSQVAAGPVAPASPVVAGTITEVGLAGLMLFGISLTSHAAAAPTPLPLRM